MTSAVTQTVRVRLPPDTTAPSLARSFPSSDTTYLWRDSLVTVRWTVSEDRLLDSVRINDSVLDPSPGIKTFPLSLRPGLNLAVLRAVDRAGNATLDTLRLTLGARGAYDSSLASLKLTLPGGRTMRSMLRPALLNYADTVAWDDTVVTVSAVGADSTDTVLDPTKAGLLLKSMAGWNFLGNGSDSLGFRLLPAATRNTGGLFNETGSFAMFWMTEQMGSFQGGGAYATYGDATLPLGYWVTKGQGLSLRCVMD